MGFLQILIFRLSGQYWGEIGIGIGLLRLGFDWIIFECSTPLNNEVNSCYNMSVKEFECSDIHDLFKVCFIRPCVFSFKFSNKMSNFPSSIHRLC